MGFFVSNKPKVIRGLLGDLVTFNIGYVKSGASKGYKKELLKRIIGSSICLVIINSKLMYQDQVKKYSSSQPDITRLLDDLQLHYKILSIKRKVVNKLFGFQTTQGEDKFYNDHIIGLLIEGHTLESIDEILDQYNLAYYVDCIDYSRDEILEKLERWFDDEEILKEKFRYFVFDDNYVMHLVVHCKAEDEEDFGKVF